MAGSILATRAPNRKGVFSLDHSDAKRLIDRDKQARVKGIEGQMRLNLIMQWLGGLPLSVLFVVLNSYFAARATLSFVVPNDGRNPFDHWSGAVEQWMMIALAASLIISNTVVGAVKELLPGWFRRRDAAILFAGLTWLNILTSAYGISQDIASRTDASSYDAARYASESVLVDQRQTVADQMAAAVRTAEARYADAHAQHDRAQKAWDEYREAMTGTDPWTVNATHRNGPGRPFVEAIEAARDSVAGAEAMIRRAEARHTEALAALEAAQEKRAEIAYAPPVTLKMWAGFERTTGVDAFTIIMIFGIAIAYLSSKTQAWLAANMLAPLHEAMKRASVEEGRVEKEVESMERAEAKAARRGWLDRWLSGRSAPPDPVPTPSPANDAPFASVRYELGTSAVQAPPAYTAAVPTPCPTNDARPWDDPGTLSAWAARNVEFIREARARVRMKHLGPSLTVASVQKAMGGSRDKAQFLRAYLCSTGEAHRVDGGNVIVGSGEAIAAE